MKPLAALTLASALILSSQAVADGKTQQQCASDFDACIAECETTYKDDASGRAACMPRCSGQYAACDAGVAYDKAKPWLEEQAKKTKKFFEDMMKDLKKDPAPEDDPTKKSI
ncbi:MAG: hypothetical protein JJ900_16670 [Rhodospirillales bacterium]|nr:hypothetical protein [Rhodospirillales bacterium]MBO6788484.1 hypothetical protein [Rhodospirillales bacterium]